MSCHLPSCTHRADAEPCPVHPTLQAHSTGRVYLIEGESVAGSEPERLLVLEFAIDCPACGQQFLQVAGHHLRALQQTVRTAIDSYPELTGSDSSTRVLETIKFSAPARRPENN